MSDKRVLDDLNRLLDRYERNPAEGGQSLRIDVSTFDTQRALDQYLAALAEAGALGCLVIRARRGRRRNEPPMVNLGDPAALYTYLGRTPPSLEAARTMSRLASGITEPWLLTALTEVANTWSYRRDWYGLAPGDQSGVGKVAALSRAILAGLHHGLDYRSLSVDVAGDSKFLESYESAIVRLISFAQPIPSGHPRAALSALGLDRIAIPLHLSAAIAVGGERVPASLPYLAVPHESVPEITFWRQPEYLLTIENLVSFHRHAVELNRGFDGLIVYTGGQPSLSWQRSMTRLQLLLPPDIPIFHWSDIDAGGLEIFRKVETVLGKASPHLMTAELADMYGYEPPAPVVRAGQFAGSAVSALADYLSKPGSKCLEQEALKPSIPQ